MILAFDHMSRLVLMAAAMYGPSGFMRIVTPQLQRTSFPRLPNWFWVPCGVWEISGMMSLVSWNMPSLGQFQLYSFMGGVLFSIVKLEDMQGNTLISGEGTLGEKGRGAIIPCCFGIYLIWAVDSIHDSRIPIVPILEGTLGWAFGSYLENKSKQEQCVQLEKRYV